MEEKCKNCAHYKESISDEYRVYGLCEFHSSRFNANYWIRECEICIHFKPISSQSMGEMSEKKGTQVPD